MCETFCVCTNLLKTLGSKGNIEEWKKWLKISDYITDSVLFSFCRMYLSYKPHWRETENAFKHYGWDWKLLEGQKKWRYSPWKLVTHAQCGTFPLVPAALSVLSVVYSTLSPCNGRTKLGSLSPPFSCFQVRFPVVSFWWDTIAGLWGTHMHILPSDLLFSHRAWVSQELLLPCLPPPSLGSWGKLLWRPPSETSCFV